MAKTILVLGGLLAAELDTLAEHFQVLRLNPRDAEPEQLLQTHGREIVGLVSSPGIRVGAPLIEALPNLEIVSQFGVGVDNIDFAVTRKRGIAVTNTPDLVTNDTADIALTLMLGLARRAMEADLYVRVGKWPAGPLGLGTSLTGRKIGILGLGNIGKAIAKRAAAFEMNVLYHGRNRQADQPWRFVDSLPALAAESDFLVVSCPATAETQGIVNADILNALGPNGFLINIARGSIVDEEALLIALRNKDIAGAGLDVFVREPHVPEALVKMDNVVLLPHIGTATFETRTKMGRLVVDNLLAHFSGNPLLTPVKA